VQDAFRAEDLPDAVNVHLQRLAGRGWGSAEPEEIAQLARGYGTIGPTKEHGEQPALDGRSESGGLALAVDGQRAQYAELHPNTPLRITNSSQAPGWPVAIRQANDNRSTTAARQDHPQSDGGVRNGEEGAAMTEPAVAGVTSSAGPPSFGVRVRSGANHAQARATVGPGTSAGKPFGSP
jgi:hypothetical protein